MVRRVIFLTLTLFLLNLVTPPTHARTTCSDRAYAIYLDCLSIQSELSDLYHDFDLYSQWEREHIMKRYRKCEKFNETDRLSDCVGRHRFGTEKWREMFPD